MGDSSQGASWGRGPWERRASGRTAHRRLVLRQPVNWAHIAEQGQCTQTELRRGGGGQLSLKASPVDVALRGLLAPSSP